MSDGGRDDDTDTSRRHRRTFLATAAGAGAALLAGCTDELPTGGLLGGDDGSDPTTPEGENEADVKSVRLEGSGSDRTFEVTIQNRGDSGHVDWWQVERADGTVGNDDPIVRQETEITDRETVREDVGGVEDGETVVVRAHHTEGEYGGKAIVARPTGGKLAMVRQGRDPAPQGDHSFDDGLLPF